MKEKCIACGDKAIGIHNSSPYCAKHMMQLKRHNKILERTRFDSNEIIKYSDYAEICLYNKKQEIIAKTKIDLEDVEKCKKLRWHLKVSNKNKLYVQHRSGRLYLTHFLLGFEKQKNFEIDHINGDSLDNRKINLKISTHQENMMNQRVLPSNNTSGYIGVTWNKNLEKWDAQIKIDGKHIYLGSYVNIEDSIKARKDGELKYFGKNKFINFEDNDNAN